LSVKDLFNNLDDISYTRKHNLLWVVEKFFENPFDFDARDNSATK